MTNRAIPNIRANQGETSPYFIVELHPVQTRTPNGLSLKQNGHFIVSFVIATPGRKIYFVFVGILDDYLALVKLLVPIDDCYLIGVGYHN